MQEADLTGAWLLVEWSAQYPDGRRTEPFGTRPRGLIMYSADGWMSAILMRADRTPFGSYDIRTVGRDERARAFDEYLSYAGRWRLDDGTLHHEVEFALNPQLMGTTQVREAQLARDQLTLTATETLLPSGDVRRHVIRWRRAGR
ncbi:MAG TPA: lipocalin-like domain-containing protein [Steroidobacteraceae bacterium]|nr:lipocalin-like domain-containing protein [Steroidobacteraceae bacterium]